MNSFFASVFHIKEPILDVDESCYRWDASVTEKKAFEALRLVKKNAGAEGIPSWVFRNFDDCLAKPVQHLINFSLSSSRFPAVLKYADVVPVPKFPNASSVEHFRPISLLLPPASV